MASRWITGGRLQSDVEHIIYPSDTQRSISVHQPFLLKVTQYAGRRKRPLELCDESIKSGGLFYVFMSWGFFLWLQAVRLLKKGGVLVYSTCTVTLAENEEQVAWALDAFPCLTLQPQVTNTKHHHTSGLL